MGKVSKGAKIRSRYNQGPHLAQDTNGKLTNPKTGTFTNSEDPDEMPYHAAFHQGLHSLLW